ncbi:MAG: hypothetical protein AB7V46_24460 [Thermomicrobiales bacterium]
MATQPNSTRLQRWNSAISIYRNLNHQLAKARPPESERLERALAAQQDALLDLPAPSYEAVRVKLECLWEGDLHGMDRSSEEKRLILEDLHDLSAAAAALIGERV